MNTFTRTLLQSAYAAIDDMIFAPATEIPALSVTYTRRFTVYAAALKTCPTACECALCGAKGPVAALDTDYTYECAVRSYSFEREDELCQACRDDFEHEYGRYPYDAADHTWDDR